jgi:hypothetical protein
MEGWRQNCAEMRFNAGLGAETLIEGSQIFQA